MKKMLAVVTGALLCASVADATYTETYTRDCSAERWEKMHAWGPVRSEWCGRRTGIVHEIGPSALDCVLPPWGVYMNMDRPLAELPAAMRGTARTLCNIVEFLAFGPVCRANHASAGGDRTRPSLAVTCCDELKRRLDCSDDTLQTWLVMVDLGFYIGGELRPNLFSLSISAVLQQGRLPFELDLLGARWSVTAGVGGRLRYSALPTSDYEAVSRAGWFFADLTATARQLGERVAAALEASVTQLESVLSRYCGPDGRVDWDEKAFESAIAKAKEDTATLQTAIRIMKEHNPAEPDLLTALEAVAARPEAHLCAFGPSGCVPNPALADKLGRWSAVAPLHDELQRLRDRPMALLDSVDWDGMGECVRSFQVSCLTRYGLTKGQAKFELALDDEDCLARPDDCHTAKIVKERLARAASAFETGMDPAGRLKKCF